jgi:translin
VAAYGELGNGGVIRDAQKELAEGSITLALVTGKSLPSPSELGVDAAAYLNGLGEAVGELRRYLLDSMRRGDLSRGEELLAAMDDIYSVLVTMDFPDAITGGLRRTTDMVRGVLEKTRSDLTLAISQKDLEKRLDRLEKDLP